MSHAPDATRVPVVHFIPEFSSLAACGGGNPGLDRKTSSMADATCTQCIAGGGVRLDRGYIGSERPATSQPNPILDSLAVCTRHLHDLDPESRTSLMAVLNILFPTLGKP